MSYHLPVMAAECLEALAIIPDGTYIDATFGGGGHAALILQKLSGNGRLVAFDQDEDAIRNLPDDPRLIFVHHNFRYLRRYLKLHGIRRVDGILADLGVSSHQLDDAGRGFSYRFDSNLDMRMNRQGERTAADLLNNYSPDELQRVFSEYGEVRNARTLAAVISRERKQNPVRTVGDLVALLEPLVRGQRQRYFSQVFQALRIELNDEMDALKDLLEQALEVLRPGGRLAIIAYHSVEDRIVKNFLKTGNVSGKLEKDFYGNIHRPFLLITKKAIHPPAQEIGQNPRARSARLRIAEKKIAS